MKKVRASIFETNSSATHTLVLSNIDEVSYYPPGSKIAIRWADTDDDYCYTTLQEKVSYLVSHLARKYKYSVYTYEDLLSEIRNDYEFRELQDYLSDLRDGYEIVFPPSYDGDIEEIVNINHQLIENYLVDVLNDLIEPDTLQDKLKIVLSQDQRIELGRD